MRKGTICGSVRGIHEVGTRRTNRGADVVGPEQCNIDETTEVLMRASVRDEECIGD
jgi:hypothetical protein